ncbi:MAG: glycoside hydrolase family 27 protein [Streptosporangiaceae bacterium]|nr:glycoside hydrolase family 27 protein [Streptosporangiaceae bacterium]
MAAQRAGALAAAVAAALVTALSATGCGSAAPAETVPANVCSNLVASPVATPPPVDPGRPVMGFDPYNTFGITIGQALIAGAARAMVRNGMRSAGYGYIILDDGWQGGRTPSGQLTADPGRFPCGIERLAAFVHAEGFRFGIYTSPAPRACSGRTGSAGHVAADARTFAAWGVDYVKLDWCGSDYSPSGAAAIARTWRAALSATRRPMILSINAGGAPSVGSWAHLIANSWRVGGDICGSWYNQTTLPPATARRCYTRLYNDGIYDYLTSPGLQAQAALAGPGHYIDPDMLEVGTVSELSSGKDLATYALVPAEAGTNFAMWSMWSAPLIAGNDPRAMNGADVASQILLNREIIAVDQDSLGHPATLLLSRGDWQVWRKPLSGGRAAVAVVNLANTPSTALFSWADLGIGGQPASLSDAWTQRGAPVTGAGVRVQLAAHATAMYVISGR